MTSDSPNAPNTDAVVSEPVQLPPAPTSPEHGLSSPPPVLSNSNLPKNAQSIALMLKSFGINDIQPCVVFQLQEFAHRYINDVLQDALILSEHCDKTTVDSEDIKEAIQGRVHHSFAPPPSQDFVRDLAKRINKVPLPIIHDKVGVRLPPEKYCLTATSYQIVPDPSAVNMQIDSPAFKSPQNPRVDLGEESEDASEINDFTEVNDEDGMNDIENSNAEKDFQSPQIKNEVLENINMSEESKENDKFIEQKAENGEGEDDFDFEEVDDSAMNEGS